MPTHNRLFLIHLLPTIREQQLVDFLLTFQKDASLPFGVKFLEEGWTRLKVKRADTAHHRLAIRILGDGIHKEKMVKQQPHLTLRQCASETENGPEGYDEVDPRGTTWWTRGVRFAKHYFSKAFRISSLK
ncbi:MAG: hypothetical protein II278_01055 [Bacteroidaceae bacterium]|nr:hypothetical protein [Bacteroidaceae bacterium]